MKLYMIPANSRNTYRYQTLIVLVMLIAFCMPAQATTNPYMRNYNPCTPATIPVLAANADSVCPGTIITLSIGSGQLNDAGNWRWYRDSASVYIYTDSGTSISVSPLSTTDYYVRGEGGCAQPGSYGLITVHVNDTPRITLAPIYTFCHIPDSIDAGVGYSSYVWSTGATSRKILPGSSGYYTLTVTKAGCHYPGTDTFIVSTISKTIATPIKDTTICKGDSATLKAAMGAGYTWTWRGGGSSTSQSVTVHPTSTTTYTLTEDAFTYNLINDGDFENPLDSTPVKPNGTGKQYPLTFTSSYKDTLGQNSLWPEGYYSIQQDPKFVHSNFAICIDHTTGHGHMMVVNGGPTAGSTIWSEHINHVVPYTTYVFSCWATAETPTSPPLLQCMINNQAVGSPLQVLSPTSKPSAPLCQWQQLEITWTSGSATSADISIVDQLAAISGNDFSIDDISFQTAFVCADTVVVHMDTIMPIISVKPAKVVMCEYKDTTIKASGAHTYEWMPGYLQGTQVKLAPTVTTTYTVTGTDIHNCISNDTFVITIIQPHVNYSLNIDASTANDWTLIPLYLATRPVTYIWNWGDSTAISTDSFPHHAYKYGGSHVICLTITDSFNCSATYCSSTISSAKPLTINMPTSGINTITTMLPIHIYPNPNNGVFTIDMAITGYAHADVYDMIGNRVLSVPLNSGSRNTLDAHTLAPGVYMLEINNGTRISAQKIVVRYE